MESDDKKQLRQLDINQSMTKPLMMLGCDRRLLLTSSLACVYIGFNLGISQGSISITVLAIVLWIVIRFGLKMMAKEDPMMLDAFQRSLLYKNGRRENKFFFPAHSSIDATVPAHVKKRWL